jgi:predicted RNA binding protein YcfA (HicA-like mRNA interferase family)
MSSIDYRKLRSLTARRLIRALERDGFVLEDRGKHLYYRHPDGTEQVCLRSQHCCHH